MSTSPPNLEVMAHELQDIRATVRRFLGDAYRERIDPCIAGLVKSAEVMNKTVLERAIEVAKRTDITEMQRLMVLTAAVEHTEPTR